MCLLQLVCRSARENSTATIICPGSGYRGFVKEPEEIDATEWLIQHNIVGIVLEYRLPKSNAYHPLYDAQRGIRIICAKDHG